jgi:hypothetical protein
MLCFHFLISQLGQTGVAVSLYACGPEVSVSNLGRGVDYTESFEVFLGLQENVSIVL